MTDLLNTYNHDLDSWQCDGSKSRHAENATAADFLTDAICEPEPALLFSPRIFPFDFLFYICEPTPGFSTLSTPIFSSELLLLL